MFKYSLDNKRYHTLNYYYQIHFKSKVFKVNLNAGLTCPNKVNGKGCIFCSPSGSGDFAGSPSDDLITQFNQVKNIMEKKWPNSKYIAYFQAGTNTYAPLKILKKNYETVLKLPNVVGLNIATRSDAINNEVLEYLETLNNKTNLTIELGLQSMHEKTLKLIERGHTLENFENMVKKLKALHIKVVVHIINGLPFETKEDMLETVKYLNKLKIDGIKIHMLHITKNTKLADIYEDKPFHLLTKEEYIDIVCDQLEYLDENIVIHRITGDPKKEDLIAPTWLFKKFTVLNDIDKELTRRNTYQGFRKSILNYSKREIDELVKPTDICIDATIGNGNDILYLCQKAKHVYGFDIQQDALNNTKKLLKDFNNYDLFLTSHEQMLKTLPELKNKISLIIFNLGYLPNGDKNITTKSKTTIKAIKDSLKLLNNKGKILLTIYPGFKNGKTEELAIRKYLQQHDISFTEHHNTDNNEAPFLIVINNQKLC